MDYLIVYGERQNRPATKHEAVMAGAKVGGPSYHVWSDPIMESHYFQIDGESLEETLTEAKQYAESFMEKQIQENPKLYEWRNKEHVFSRILNEEWDDTIIHNDKMPDRLEHTAVRKSVITYQRSVYIEIRWNSSLGTIVPS